MILLASAAFCLTPAATIRRNLMSGVAFGRVLLTRMRGLGLFRMLEALGIDPTRYVHGTPIHRIEQQLRNCEACTETDACHKALDGGDVHGADDYSPNHADLSDTRSVH